jgi:hypothetical protein
MLSFRSRILNITAGCLPIYIDRKGIWDRNLGRILMNGSKLIFPQGRKIPFGKN